MWRNPKYYPETTAPAEAPEETGTRLATFVRDNGKAELRLTRDSYEGHPYLSLRLWRRGQDGALWPTKKGVSVRMAEAAELSDALAMAADEARARHKASPPAESPPTAPANLQERRVEPISLPRWLAEAGAGFDGPPVALQGSARQIHWAESIRATKIETARRRAPELVAVLSVIKDATWFLANRETPLASLAWPSPDQVEQRVDTTPSTGPA